MTPMMAITYATLMEVRALRALPLFFIAHKDSEGAVEGYSVIAVDPAFTLRAEAHETDKTNFETYHKPTAVEVPDETIATVRGYPSAPTFLLRQERQSNGHYEIVPFTILDVPAGEVRYIDVVAPALPEGWDWLSGKLPTHNLNDGDEVVCMKLMVPQAIAQVAQNATAGDTTIVIASTLGVLRRTKLGGALDPGFFLSFGTPTATAASLNAGPPAATSPRTFSNPDGELREYRIQGFSEETPIPTTPNAAVGVQLFEALGEDIPAGTPVNLITRAINAPLPLTKGETLDLGGASLTSGPIPPTSIIRVGYKNNGESAVSARGRLDVMY